MSRLNVTIARFSYLYQPILHVPVTIMNICFFSYRLNLQAQKDKFCNITVFNYLVCFYTVFLRDSLWVGSA